jgi:mRNA (guanine-N7-)-methyltransferase
MEFVPLKVEDLVDYLDTLVNCMNAGVLTTKTEPPVPAREAFHAFVEKELSNRRHKSSISRLRKFHNFIKQTLITNISRYHRGPINCLDIAVGRGGDMWKWDSAGIKKVFGFDKSKESITSINPLNQGAQERYRANVEKLSVEIEYTVADAVDPESDIADRIYVFMRKNKIDGFELMSCQFAMHYFFESREKLDLLFKRFSLFIKKGGYFIGTCADGSRIKKLTPNNNLDYKSEILEIHRKKASRSVYGNRYTFKINDINDNGNYFNTMGISTEYLVDTSELIKVAGANGFKPVFLNFFERIPNRNEYSRLDMVPNRPPGFMNFEEIYSFYPNQDLTPQELEVNGLYTTFIFVKV